MATAGAMPLRRRGSNVVLDNWLTVDEGHSYEETQEPRWELHPVTCPPVWQELQCYGASLSSREQSVILDSAIDKLYEDLGLLIQQRNPLIENADLEQRIASLFQCIKT